MNPYGYQQPQYGYPQPQYGYPQQMRRREPETNPAVVLLGLVIVGVLIYFAVYPDQLNALINPSKSTTSGSSAPSTPPASGSSTPTTPPASGSSAPTTPPASGSSTPPTGSSTPPAPVNTFNFKFATQFQKDKKAAVLPPDYKEIIEYKKIDYRPVGENDWKSLKNGYSLDLRKYPGAAMRRNPGDTWLRSYLANRPEFNGHLNLFPFKLVTLQWLIDIGKCIIGDPCILAFDSSDGGMAGTLDFRGLMNFSETDQWLPMGDAAICMGSKNLPNAAAEMVICLVYNHPDYSYIIKPNEWVFRAIGDGCHSGHFGAWINASVPSAMGPNGMYVGFSTITVSYGPKTHMRTPVIAAPHKYYLAAKDGHKEQPWYIGSETNGCDWGHDAWFTSPFHTFNVRSEWKGWGYVHFGAYVDIVPEKFLIENLVGQSTSDVPTSTFYINRFFANMKPIARMNLLGLFCKDVNLTTKLCSDYCTSDDNDCDLEYFHYCDEHDNPDICACFKNDWFYANFLDQSTKDLPDSVKVGYSGMLSSGPLCMYPACGASGTPKRRSTTTRTCPSNIIQNCINTAGITNSGSTQDIVSNVVNNCITANAT
jgi:hypothetical protein